ncbi:DsbA family protein [Salinibius halmophilus]|uniref:DsbA family protein n=1 Tax=Salinibius halmophilus TaxID=1853216 RepID=UPI000E66E58A|nr:DsbA family protein [Salinibius halmophilus]
MKKLLVTGLLMAAPFTFANDDVDAQVEQKLNEYFASEEFDQVIDDAINRYVVRQQEAQRDAQRQAARDQASSLIPVGDNDYVRGNPDARFTLLEYSDYECSFCKRFHSTAKQFLERNEDVNWVYRHFPLDFHNPLATRQAEAAECVGKVGGNDAFWAYSDAIFERTNSNGNGMDAAELVPMAVELGLDEAEVQACIDAGEFRPKIQLQIQNAQSAGVSGTPGNFLLDNETGDVIPLAGAQPLQTLESALADLAAE